MNLGDLGNLIQQFTLTLHEHSPYVGTAFGDGLVCNVDCCAKHVRPPLAISHFRDHHNRVVCAGVLDDGAASGRPQTHDDPHT